MKVVLSNNTKLFLFFLLTITLAIYSKTSLPNYFAQLNSEQLWLTHLTMELLSTFVAVSIVAILMQRMTEAKNHLANTLIFSFTSIALLNYMHALSFQGVPVFAIDNFTEKAIFFWLPARTLEFLALLGIAFHLSLPSHKVVWLLAGVMLAAVIAYTGVYHLDKLPSFVVQFTGLAQLKVSFGYFFVIANTLLATTFIRQYRTSNKSKHLYFAGSCYLVAIFERLFLRRPCHCLLLI